MSLQAELAATFVDEWCRAGVRQAVLCPGSRSAPLALALLAERRLSVQVRLDERSAGFFALGAALASGRPVVVVVTSGTAAGELHPAVLEADLAGVPLVVVTADRPPELHQVAAPQTVDQAGLFGSAVRLGLYPGVLDEASRPHWRSYASRLVAEAVGAAGRPGPVHANLAFREPLGGKPGTLPPGRPGGRPWHEVVRAPGAPVGAVDRLLEAAAGAARGVVLAGAGAAGTDPEGAGAVLALAGRLGWPVLAEARAWPRQPDESATVVAAADLILRAEAAGSLQPDLLLHLGAPPVSKVVATWSARLAAGGVPRWHVEGAGRFLDPERAGEVLLVADPGRLAAAALERLGPHPPAPSAPGPARAAGVGRQVGGWAARWAAAEGAAQAAIDATLSAEGPTIGEAWLARALHEAVPAGSTLVVSSSMPVRHLEWLARPRPGAPRVLANRGANGIDGVVSTVLGAAAATGGPTIGLLGDLAFLHDVSALVWGREELVPRATLVVVDNGGGEIFSSLPYAKSVEAGRFARGFTTPQRHDLSAVAAGFGWPVAELARREDLVSFLAEAAAAPGIAVVLARTDPRATQATMGALGAAVEPAVRRALAGAVAG